jgi:hypothetical protein
VRAQACRDACENVPTGCFAPCFRDASLHWVRAVPAGPVLWTAGVEGGRTHTGPGGEESHMVAESRNVSRGKARSRSPTASQKTPARSKSPLPIKRANGEGKSKSRKQPTPGFVLVLLPLVLAAGAMIAFQKGMVPTNISTLLTSGASGNVEFMGFSGRKVHFCF